MRNFLYNNVVLVSVILLAIGIPLWLFTDEPKTYIGIGLMVLAIINFFAFPTRNKSPMIILALFLGSCSTAKQWTPKPPSLDPPRAAKLDTIKHPRGNDQLFDKVKDDNANAQFAKGRPKPKNIPLERGKKPRPPKGPKNPPPPPPPPTDTLPPPPIDTLPTDTIIAPPPPPPAGQSYDQVFLLKFSGETVISSSWNGGNPIVCASAGLTAAQEDTIVARVARKYWRYNVYVTKDESIWLKAKPYSRMKCIITDTYWRPGASGWTYNNSFTWGDDTPCFVFSSILGDDPHYISEIVTHELGHSVSLNHQSEFDANCTLINTYRMGPIMGNSLYNQGYWYNGNGPCCQCHQNDEQILADKLTLRQ